MSDSKSQAVGYAGEDVAQKYLLRKGLRLIQKNYSCKLGEIDLIMQDGDVRVFVEVRLRAPTLYGRGLETVSFSKQRKIINTTRFYQQQEDYWGDVRFDVISIEKNVDAGEETIEHIADAFGE